MTTKTTTNPQHLGHPDAAAYVQRYRDLHAAVGGSGTHTAAAAAAAAAAPFRGGAPTGQGGGSDLRRLYSHLVLCVEEIAQLNATLAKARAWVRVCA